MRLGSDTHEVDIQMSARTVEALQQNGFSLIAMKAVQGGGIGCVPLVWSQTSQIQTTNTIVWGGDYAAYISSTTITPNIRIDASASLDADPGAIIQITGHGALDGGTGGTADAFTIQNQTTDDWTVGISQEVQGALNPVCALPLRHSFASTLKPLPLVLLTLTTANVTVGTVLEKALSSSLLIDLTEASLRTVQFDIDMGWGWDGGSWGRTVNAYADLIPLLIQR